jgi:hypothetical protein
MKRIVKNKETLSEKTTGTFTSTEINKAGVFDDDEIQSSVGASHLPPSFDTHHEQVEDEIEYEEDFDVIIN